MKPNSIPFLRPATPDEFLPPVSRWLVLGGLILIGGLGLIGVLMAVLPYRVTVKAEARVRPSGEVRLVEAPLEGTIERLEVQENQMVQQGDVIARLDRNALDAQKNQVEGNVQQLQLQLTQLDAQLRWLDHQSLAQSRSIEQEVAMARAEADRQQWEYGTQQITTQADLVEAEATLEFAQNEMRRYEQLVNSGSVSQLQLDEKRAAVRTAAARVTRTRALLDPSAASIAIAQERIAQVQDNGEVTLATLNRERESLKQQRSELWAQLLQAQQTRQQVERQLQNSVIRATSDGVILRLNLRNANQLVQSGETIAEISPQGSAMMLKAWVAPQAIGQIKVGQTAFLRVSACPVRDYGILRSTVTQISPDAMVADSVVANSTAADSTDAGPITAGSTAAAANAQRYYEVTLQPQQTTLIRGNRQCSLQLGMEAEARIVTRQETLLGILKNIRF